ncbi:MAG: O-methyltransferase [Bacteroidales bacterium]|uniref:O-methyltransferase n=1 Tax=Porphyromonas sp. TaxID=1924944 RepID=UPI00297B87FD|nr:O-methyltransferase [Porphyromonas sp.]MDD7437589.1 O-methyltransferase [Bacteroidales bacterium]MDY3066361.1 O-methyltransferase [Porphyromonas sp.]
MIERLEELAREEYIARHSSDEPDVLREITREANFSLTHPRMVSGHIQGLFLTIMTRLIRPERVLEIGTFVGYATICLAKGLPESGRLTTIEVNDELRQRIERNLEKAGVSDKVELRIGDALEVLDSLEIESFGLVYLDANKAQYPEYYEILSGRLPKGALILADNTLWGGKLWRGEYHDPQTEGIRRFNQMVADDARVDKVLMPVRDGLTMIRIK